MNNIIDILNNLDVTIDDDIDDYIDGDYIDIDIEKWLLEV